MFTACLRWTLLGLGAITVCACGGSGGSGDSLTVSATIACDSSACGGGEISPSGSVSVENGQSVTFKVTPGSGHIPEVESYCGAQSPLIGIEQS